jgi:hypothetical protein
MQILGEKVDVQVKQEPGQRPRSRSSFPAGEEPDFKPPPEWQTDPAWRRFWNVPKARTSGHPSAEERMAELEDCLEHCPHQAVNIHTLIKHYRAGTLTPPGIDSHVWVVDGELRDKSPAVGEIPRGSVIWEEVSSNQFILASNANKGLQGAFMQMTHLNPGDEVSVCLIDGRHTYILLT